MKTVKDSHENGTYVVVYVVIRGAIEPPRNSPAGMQGPRGLRDVVKLRPRIGESSQIRLARV